jgi:type VI secretion system secreted protein VgrG
VKITGKKGIIIHGHESYIKIWAGGIEHCTGDGWEVHAKDHQQTGPRSIPVPPPPPPPRMAASDNATKGDCRYMGRYQLFKYDNRPYEGYHYKIMDNAGTVLKEGVTDNDGWTDFVYTEKGMEVQAFKYIMRESERITENWEAKLNEAVQKAEQGR